MSFPPQDLGGEQEEPQGWRWTRTYTAIPIKTNNTQIERADMSSSPQELGAEEEEPQGVEMDQDFDGELHDVPEGKREEQEDEEGEEGDEERLQQEMGEAGPDEQVRFLSLYGAGF